MTEIFWNIAENFDYIIVGFVLGGVIMVVSGAKRR